MDDKEIIKALEEHYRQVDDGYSDYLLYGGKRDKKQESYLFLIRDILNLIKKQQAEEKELWEERNRIYESLKETNAELEEYRKAYTTAQAEIERLQKKYDRARKLIEEIREAVVATRIFCELKNLIQKLTERKEDEEK